MPIKAYLGNLLRMKPSISVVMPALNEERNIAAAIAGTRESLAKAGIEDYEIIVATCPDRDGRLDKTGELVEQAAQLDHRVRLLHSTAYQGLGEKYRGAVLSAVKEYVIMIPGDNENDSGSFPSLFNRMGEADMVVSYSANPEVRPLHRRIISTVYTFGLNLLFKRHMHYYNGINIYRREQLVHALPHTASFAYAAEILLTLLSRGATFVEVPIHLVATPKGSKALRWDNFLGVTKAIVDLRRRLSRR